MAGSKATTRWDGALVLSTGRLRLRTFLTEDLPAYAALNADSDVMKYLGRPLDREDSDEMARVAQRSFAESGVGKIAIERASDGTFLGMCGLSCEEWYPHDLELGWRLDRRFWGQGYASEAASAWLAYAFTIKAQLRIISIADVLNARSIAVMKRLGMTLDHTAELVHEGEAFSADIYAITRERWQSNIVPIAK
jgi:RimJ/RimL family protein N-acetyltransferase